MSTSLLKKVGESIKALGLVFGDIGTSPLYTLTVIFAFVFPSLENILGVLSLVLWMLILMVTVQYVWLAMSLSVEEQGGILVLGRIIKPLLSSTKVIFFVSALSYMGSALLIGDGFITPAISILSAVEGLHLVPGFEHLITQRTVLLLACVITLLLFAFQRYGTEKISTAFGPIMVIWFLAIGALGFYWILQAPVVLKAFNPYYIGAFVYRNPWVSFFVLSRAILVVTGGEALYADMGHLGRQPIVRAWFFSLVLLFLNYLGQGAFLILNLESAHLFFEMERTVFPQAYLLFVVLSTFATIIASQAIISGNYSLIYQGIMTEILPKFKIEYTSRELRSQIYIPFINWTLFGLVIFAILKFQNVDTLAHLYGLNTICTMVITGVVMVLIFFLRKQLVRMAIAGAITLLEVIVLLSSTSKIHYGGYWTLIIALIPFSLIMIYTLGKKKLQRSIRPLSLAKFVETYTQVRVTTTHLQGTAVFFAKKTTAIPHYIARVMFTDGVIYEDNIIVSVIVTNRPFGVNTELTNNVAKGLHLFEIYTGYMEILNIEKIINSIGIEPKVLFYGMEDIIAKKMIWKLYAFIKKITPSFVEFYKLPSDKLHGVLQRVEMV